MTAYYIRAPEDVVHFGVKGMKWGVVKSKLSGLFPKRRRDSTVQPQNVSDEVRDRRKERRRKIALIAGVVIGGYASYKLIGAARRKTLSVSNIPVNEFVRDKPKSLEEIKPKTISGKEALERVRNVTIKKIPSEFKMGNLNKKIVKNAKSFSKIGKTFSKKPLNAVDDYTSELLKKTKLNDK